MKLHAEVGLFFGALFWGSFLFLLLLLLWLLWLLWIPFVIGVVRGRGIGFRDRV